MSNTYSNNICRLCELAAQAYGKRVYEGIGQASVLAGFDDEDSIPTPRVVFNCDSAEPDGPADDAVWACQLEVQVVSNADDKTKDEHHDLASEVFSQFFIGRENTCDAINVAAREGNPPVQFFCQDILPGNQAKTIQDRKWISSAFFRVICSGKAGVLNT
jgi:hypothetical protein